MFIFKFHLRSCADNVKIIEGWSESMPVHRFCKVIKETLKIQYDVVGVWKDGEQMDHDDVVYSGIDMEVRRMPAPPTLAIFNRSDQTLSEEEKMRRLREMRKKVLYGWTPVPVS